MDAIPIITYIICFVTIVWLYYKSVNYMNWIFSKSSLVKPPQTVN